MTNFLNLNKDFSPETETLHTKKYIANDATTKKLEHCNNKSFQAQVNFNLICNKVYCVVKKMINFDLETFMTRVGSFLQCPVFYIAYILQEDEGKCKQSIEDLVDQVIALF